MAEKMCLGVTPGGKHLYAKNRFNRNILEIYFEEGGELPAELSGGFSDRTAAQNAVNVYLSRPFKKEKKQA